jgi:magnesium chelatase family protein
VLAKVHSCAIVGLEGAIVEVEVDTSRGLPSFVIVGLPDAAVQESRERVQAAVKNAGLEFPRHRLTVNLAPASLRKEGPAYDLPIALGALAATGQIRPGCLDRTLALGELSLDGSVRHVRGVLPMAALARQESFERVLVPVEDAREAALVPGLEVIPVASLTALVNHLSGVVPIQPAAPATRTAAASYIPGTDFGEIKGQEHVKRALEVAAAGGHNVLLAGPPGAGKTLLARALPSILPAMTIDEALDVTRIYSVADPAVRYAADRDEAFRSPSDLTPGSWAAARAARRDLAGASRGIVSGRAARVRHARPGGAASADGGQARHHQPRPRLALVPGQLHARCRHESVPVRLLR